MKQIVDAINEEINNLRRLAYFLENETFAVLYSTASETQKLRVDLLIKDRNAVQVKVWMDNQKASDLRTMSLVDLKQTARGLSIPKADRYGKDQLMSLITEQRKKNDRGTA